MSVYNNNETTIWFHSIADYYNIDRTINRDKYYQMYTMVPFDVPGLVIPDINYYPNPPAWRIKWGEDIEYTTYYPFIPSTLNLHIMSGDELDSKEIILNGTALEITGENTFKIVNNIGTRNFAFCSYIVSNLDLLIGDSTSAITGVTSTCYSLPIDPRLIIQMRSVLNNIEEYSEITPTIWSGGVDNSIYGGPTNIYPNITTITNKHIEELISSILYIVSYINREGLYEILDIPDMDSQTVDVDTINKILDNINKIEKNIIGQL